MRQLAFLTFWALFVAGCGGGGSSGGGDGGPSIVEESYAESDFDYQDPHPATFHPMGRSSSQITPRDELLMINVPEDPANARATIFDDIGAGAGVLGEVATILGAGAYRTAAAGNLDDDAEEELAILRIAGSTLEISVISRAPDGSYQGAPVLTIPSSGFPYREARLTLGDVDGDHRDEFLVVARRSENGEPTSDVWMRVYDDPQDGGGLLHELDWPFTYPREGIEDLRAEAVDLDGDGRAEIALLAQKAGSFLSATVSLRVLDDAQADFADLRGWFEFEDLLPSGGTGSRLVAGNFDGDANGEFTVYVCSSQNGSGSTRVQTFGWDDGALAGAARRTRNFSRSFGTFEFKPYRAWDAAAIDRDADGVDELALLAPDPISNWNHLSTLRWDGSAWIDDLRVELFVDVDDGASLVSTDDDADGQDELYFCRMSGSSGSSTKSRLSRRIDFGAANPITNSWTSTAQSAGRAYAPVLVAGDFDADGLTIRYTGRKFTSLSDPMPLVVLSAAPTKAGISQNYNGTSTTYSVTTNSSESFGVTSAVTVSAYSEATVEGIFGLFDASARQTIEHSFATSRTTTRRESNVQGFTGPADQDAIVFQGTLYQSYEYEVLASQDPGLVGELLTFDVPVASRVYKWSVAYYNAQVRPGLQIGPDVLSHTVGDPASYPTRTVLTTATAPYVSWRSREDPPMSVGQTQGGSNFVAIELEEETSTTEERTFGVDWEVGFSAGGAGFGGSFGVTAGDAYTVTVSQVTRYDGVVGDITTIADYEAWRYEFGMVVYHRGLLADAQNQPLEQETGVLPYQVIRFWVTPTGTAY